MNPLQVLEISVRASNSLSSSDENKIGDFKSFSHTHISLCFLPTLFSLMWVMPICADVASQS
uniref:Uncharacterized protein n=1 Tax=Nelumbo nucifera TaxID=4432 RepID=A0A822Y424_NELNU|nr:TPA_asm: hypothetical protein HUJ06_028779 [Nelumbo nucifera]